MTGGNSIGVDGVGCLFAGKFTFEDHLDAGEVFFCQGGFRLAVSLQAFAETKIAIVLVNR